MLSPENSGALAMRSAIVAMLVLLGIALWFANAGYRTLAEPDEARYAEIPREMLASGDWITPHLNGIPYLEKPPLQYWATATAYSVFGFSPWVSRLWVTTLGLLGVVVTYLTGRLLWGSRTGELAALILASCPLYFVVAHINTLDIALAFFMNAALACFLAAQLAGSDPLAERRWMWLCWMAMALGFLQKGLVAVALPAITLVAYSIVYRELRLWRRLHIRAGVVILAIITVPWLVLISQRNPGFLQFFFIHEHVARFATTVHKRAEPWWFFVAILSVGVLPWINAILHGAFARWRNPDTEGARATGMLHAEGLLTIWTLAQLLFFSLSGSKLATYIVPAAAPLALLAARWLQQRGTVKSLWPVVIISGAFSLLWLLMSPLIPHLIEPGPRQTAYLAVASWGRTAGLISLVGIGAALIAMRYRNLPGAVAALSIGFVAALSVFLCGGNSLDVLRVRPSLANVIAPHLTADTPFYCVGMYWQTLPFELRRTCIVVEHAGELELQFDPQQKNWLPRVEDFAKQWAHEPSAVAVVNPVFWEQLQATGLAPRAILHEPNVIVIVKP
jgi:4-amino-4-deoxy-L-arabinose transferase-like glycosyltransferase